MTDQERINQLTTNLQASLVLNNIKQVSINQNKRIQALGFWGAIKNFFSK